MPVTKNPMLRYRILDDCFRNTARDFTIDELLVEINRRIELTEGNASIVQLRQLRYDIAHMQSEEGWSIDLIEDKIGKKRIYRYSDISYSIINSPLSDIQIEGIQSLISLLEGYADNPEMNHILNTLDTLKLTADNSRLPRKIIGIGSNPFLKGREHLLPIYQSIKSEDVLEIEYQKFGDENVQKHIAHPQYLKEFNQRWFLVAVPDEEKKQVRIFPLDRIQKFKPIKKAKYFEKEIDWEEEYFADIIGVTNNLKEEPVEIKMRFLNGRGHYVETKPIHASQKPMTWIDQKTSETSIFVKKNNELISVLLSFGIDLKIISPKELLK